jgi:hypothetical protein
VSHPVCNRDSGDRTACATAAAIAESNCSWVYVLVVLMAAAALLLAPIADGSASEGLLDVGLLEGDIRQQMIKLLGCEGRHLLAVIANSGNDSW